MALYYTFLMALSILTLNANGLRDASKRAGLLQWLRTLAVDVICLQEAHCISANECQAWFLSSGFSFSVSPGTNKSCGSLILFRPFLTFVDSWCDPDGRFLQCEFSLYGKAFRVATVYAPNRNPARDQLFDDVSSNIDPSIPTVLAGEFNTVFDRTLDRSGSLAADTSRESTVALTRLFDNCCVTDIWRYLHPSSSRFTWSRWNGLMSSRIDLIGCPYVWVSSVSSCEIIPCPYSDHCAVLFCVSIPDTIPPGPGLWKLNTSVLEEEEYVRLITDFWVDWKRQKYLFQSLGKWWDAGKAKVKGLSISYCAARSQIASRSRELLSSLVEHLKIKIDEGSMSCVGPYHSALNQLALLDLEVARGAQLPLPISFGWRKSVPQTVGSLR